MAFYNNVSKNNQDNNNSLVCGLTLRSINALFLCCSGNMPIPGLVCLYLYSSNMCDNLVSRIRFVRCMTNFYG